MGRVSIRNNPERLAFYLHRVTGLILLAYFLIHVISMGAVFAGYTSFASLSSYIISSKIIRFIVIAVASIHGLNGIRLIITEYLGLAIGKPELPKPPYISGTLRAKQRVLQHVLIILAILFISIYTYILIAYP